MNCLLINAYKYNFFIDNKAEGFLRFVIFKKENEYFDKNLHKVLDKYEKKEYNKYRKGKFK